MKYLLFLSAALTLSLVVTGQNLQPSQNYCLNYKPEPLSENELLQMSKIPELIVNPIHLKASLPPVVNNAVHPFFRPIWGQSDYCCGQAAGILYNFTYEINRLRGLASDATTRQYPTHFAWNFQNGQNQNGVSYVSSFELLEKTGTPTVAEWGGTPDYGGGDRWISGYDTYYSAMHNRINNVRTIFANTPEGLNILKNWLYDHLEGSPYGGLANIYIQYLNADEQLAPGTPEAGMYVVPAFGGYANHALTIVGYNDSIRYDYNHDGQYTNHIDINSDGLIDMKDWEIGGIKVANDFGTWWGNNGFAYVMYKCLADDLGEGGIWNHSVHIIDVKQYVEPKLTMKIQIKYTARRDIGVRVGVSPDTNATDPLYLLDPTIVHFQSGNVYMLGGTTEADKTMEFGLDITELLNYLDSGQAAKFFLQVTEQDIATPDDGEILAFSLMDYTGTLQETACTGLPVAITHNGTTSLSIIHSVNFDDVKITTNAFPPATLYEPYSFNLSANGGTSPYSWFMAMEYDLRDSLISYPTVTGTLHPISDTEHGKTEISLPFSFPFYNRSFDKIYAYVDGMISFDDQVLPWPYFLEEVKNSFLQNTNCIAPFCGNLKLANSTNGVWVDTSPDSVTVFWKLSVVNYFEYDTTSVNFATSLFPNGEIRIYYGNTDCNHYQWAGGISLGNDRDYLPVPWTGQFADLNGKSVLFTPKNLLLPDDLELTEDGTLQGTPVHVYNNTNFLIHVKDNNELADSKLIPFTATGLLLETEIVSGDDALIEFGETALINVKIKNLSTAPVNTISLLVQESSPFIQMTDSTTSWPSLAAGDSVTIPGALTFNVTESLPDQTEILFNGELLSASYSQHPEFEESGFRPNLSLFTTIIDDQEDNVLQDGDSAWIRMVIHNNSLAKCVPLNMVFSTTDTNIIVISGTAMLDTLAGNSNDTVSFRIFVKDSAEREHMVVCNLNLTAQFNFAALLSADIPINYCLETFESGTLSCYPWETAGSAPWFTTSPGQISATAARSGIISHSEVSVLSINLNTLSDGNLSFYYKVSSETNYDFLKFYLDGTELASWSGEIPWTPVSFFIPEGIHEFRWVYEKDVTVSTTNDCAWLDLISFPSIGGNQPPALSYSPGSFSEVLGIGQTSEDTLFVSNSGGGRLEYSLTTMNGSFILTKSIAGSALVTNAQDFFRGDTITMTLTVNNASTDDEWLETISIDIPAGVEIISATDFTGGTDLMLFEGSTGNGTPGVWHGETAQGWGVIHGGETATASLTLFIADTFLTDLQLIYTINGDIYGQTPHDTTDTLTLINMGQRADWLTLSHTADSALGGETDEIILHYDATGLDPGIYTCEIRLVDNFSGAYFIPVQLEVIHMAILPGMIEDSLHVDSTMSRQVLVTNYTTSVLFFTASFTDTSAAYDTSWVNLTYLTDFVNAGSSKPIILNFDATGLNPGNYYCDMHILDNLSVETIIPIKLRVYTTIGILENSNYNAVQVFPNPAKDYLMIITSGKQEAGRTFTLSDLWGRTERKGKLESSEETILLDGIAKGVYILTIESNTSRMITKVIVQ